MTDDPTDKAAPTEADAGFTSRTMVTRTLGDQKANRAFAIDCARLLDDDKCEDIVILDVRGRSQVADYVVVGSGTSDRQMNSAIDDAVEMGGARGYSAARTNRDDRSTWLLADFVDVIVHIFEPDTRAYYDIEMLWGDAPRIEWTRDDSEKKA